jgi:hypothetical protein
MNKNRIIKILVPNLIEDCDLECSQLQLNTFKRLIDALPSDLINPDICSPSEGIGLEFSFGYDCAIMAIAENKIYVEKLDNDHFCDTRDEWFDFKDGDAIPPVILAFLNKYLSVQSIGLERYLEKRRRDIVGRIRARRELDEYMSKLRPFSGQEKFGRLMSFPLRKSLEYESVLRKTVEVTPLA